ncbi:DoxX family membrane protein [Aureisphaera galaxeae]|uniref:BT_3928 family protein n=1 Tax=Aureisphaera galaxeae TaxID=1538023 RepID=UPI00235079CE|nr:BT_3928 family protein [Aureisphaera galaxeae]MDC8006149.1 DoxX family membrane protein [Aureisphaera galaxeae]
MKYIVGFLRIFVGIFFIISGLIKLNDPVGFSFKLQDYFAPEVLNLEFLVPYSLAIALFVVVFEVMVGVMIIIGYAKRFTLFSLLAMIIFFTFLTFYSAYFNKVTDCGCFGDAMKLTPWESFWKDVVLLAMILVLYFGRKHIEPFFSKLTRSIIVTISLVLCLWLGYHVLMHLPVKDYRPYKIGANIEEGMTVPEDAPPPIIEYLWEYEINGEKEVIANTTGRDPKPEGGTRIGVETRFIREPYEPPIHDFSMERDDEDYTYEFLGEENLLVVIAYNLDNTEHQGFGNIRTVTNDALKKGYKVIGLSASSTAETEELAKLHKLNFKFYFCDMTTLKTIVRSNPGVLELQSGTIMQKLHWNDALDIELSEQEGAMPNLDFELKHTLDSVAVLDQKYRNLMSTDSEEERAKMAEAAGFQEDDYSIDALWAKQTAIDESNMELVAKIFDEKGYPGKSMVGEETQSAAWYVLQHSNRIPDYISIIKKAGEDGELSMRLVAMMEDRYLMGKGEPQIYGTQGQSMNGKSYIWPIEDPENVNTRRTEVGFTETVEEYAKRLFGADFEYEVLTLDDIKN